MVIAFRQYSFFEALLQILDLLEFACELHVLLDMIVSMPHSPGRHLQVLLRQRKLLNGLLAYLLQMVVFLRKQNWRDYGLDESLPHARL